MTPSKGSATPPEKSPAALTVWSEMRAEAVLTEAALIAVYAGVTEEQFLSVARDRFRGQLNEYEQRVLKKEQAAKFDGLIGRVNPGSRP